MKNNSKKYYLQQKAIPYLFILPNVLIFSTFVIIPAFFGVLYSFTNFDGLSMKFVGIKNYIALLDDTDFWNSIKLTIIFVVIVVPGIYVFSLFLGMILSKEFRTKGLFRAIFYWPTMISPIIAGLAWKWLLSENIGIVNYLLVLFGFHKIAWLTNSVNANISVVIATLWSRVGFYMVIFIAGIQSIPTSYYEAAYIDGANNFQAFFRITLPLLKPTSFLVIVLSVIDAFKSFPLVLSLTGGGPGTDTTYIVQYIYQTGFQKSELGYASAMSVILFIIIGFFTILQFRLNKGGAI
ncbi:MULTISPECIES: carbohydrate ABC transporter permease [Thermoanaerobacterium]|uniref:ABC transporter n=2 Tax=Thermoanaerobacterium TaxID=28895 RepID=W9EA70_9THEO|nr:MULTISPECIES: sugar ABC transporter permease [Thermoanaerobacterium]AFK85522.1 ABC-type transporter, integral membrane subunit [Thermoanaerobacterium saccharolyticum JW/SL-YS485]ETO37835.1 ABC transporter [Thermoanaerobacterium aotearoense SCUT27]